MKATQNLLGDEYSPSKYRSRSVQDEDEVEKKERNLIL
jgi:hypothetical protein